MSEFTLLTDTDDSALERAIERLDDWTVERVPAADLADAVGTRPAVRAAVRAGAAAEPPPALSTETISSTSASGFQSAKPSAHRYVSWVIWLAL